MDLGTNQCEGQLVTLIIIYIVYRINLLSSFLVWTDSPSSVSGDAVPEVGSWSVIGSSLWDVDSWSVSGAALWAVDCCFLVCTVDGFLPCLLVLEPIKDHMLVPTISEWPLYQLVTYYNYLLIVQAPVTDCSKETNSSIIKHLTMNIKV